MNSLMHNPLDLAALAAGGVLLLVLAARVAKAARRVGDARVVQVLALSVTMSYSGLTSWQWATTRLHAPVWERAVVFAAFEVVMLAFAVASRENRLRDGRSGWQHGATLFFAGLMSLMALQVAGSPLVAAVRFGGGPLAALLLFHSLLGLELRHQGTERESLVRAALREVRERIVSRLGIGRRGADSAAIARSRAADRAVKLAAGRKLSRRASVRLAVAVDAAQHGLGPDEAAAAEAAIVDRVVRRKSVAGLHAIDVRHVWTTSVPLAPSGARESSPEGSNDCSDSTSQALTATAPQIFPLPQRIVLDPAQTPAAPGARTTVQPSFQAFQPTRSTQEAPFPEDVNPLSEDEAELARQLREEGVSYGRIGERLGRSKSWAYRTVNGHATEG